MTKVRSETRRLRKEKRGDALPDIGEQAGLHKDRLSTIRRRMDEAVIAEQLTEEDRPIGEWEDPAEIHPQDADLAQTRWERYQRYLGSDGYIEDLPRRPYEAREEKARKLAEEIREEIRSLGGVVSEWYDGHLAKPWEMDTPVVYGGSSRLNDLYRRIRRIRRYVNRLTRVE